jgi:hypothetical protein
MLASAFYVHGEQILLWVLGVLALLILGLIALSVWLVRISKRKIGNRAYWLAPLPLLVVLLVGFAVSRAQAPNSGPPAVLPAAKLSDLMKGLSESAHFGYAGTAFYKGKLYAATNLGMLEIEQGKAISLYRFQKDYSVVSGPWLDEANQLLWVLDDQTQELVNFNGTVWRRVNLPKPPKGYYSRGDVLEGVRPAGNTNGFWLQSGGGAWRWDSTENHWTAVPMPTLDSPYADAIIGVMPLGAKLFFIVRRESLSFLVKDGQDFTSDTIVTDDGGWHAVANDSGLKFLADEWVTANESGYICTRKGELLKVTPQAITRLDSPGECEALARSASGTLLASLRRVGIYEFSTDWRLRGAAPYPSGTGDYWAHLSGSGTELAFAIDGKPVVDKPRSSGTDMKFTRNAPTALWFAKGAEFRPVDIP